MALSDTCREMVYPLIADFHGFLDQSYSAQHWSRYLTALLCLAEIYYDLTFGGPFFLDNGDLYTPPKSTYLRAVDDVLQRLLSEDGSPKIRPEALVTLAEVCMINDKLRQAVFDLYAWRKSKYGIAELLATSNPVPIEPLYELVK